MIETQSDYELLDSGDGRRLERFGPYLLARPAPQALWRPRLDRSRWEAADAVYERNSKGGGSWKLQSDLPESWTVGVFGLRFRVRPTGFGHVGLFPEQFDNWHWIDRRIRRAGGEMNVMNLFGYTGAATLVAARAGARICHIDASKGVVAWARENALESGLADKPVRWIVEDALKFLRRERRRGRRYSGLIIDPPTFGRGSKGEVWKIERDLPELLSRCGDVLDRRPDFILLGTYSPKFTPLVLGNMLRDAFGHLNGRIESFEMTIPETGGGRRMPNGVSARWAADESPGAGT